MSNFVNSSIMKKIYNLILTAFASATIAAGCIEVTVPQGSTQLAEQVSNSEFALNGMINSFSVAMMTPNTCSFLSKYGAQSDFGIPAIHLMTDSMLEDIAIQGDNPGYYQFYPWINNWGMDDQSWPIGYFWENYYAYIKIANDVIKMIDVEAPDFSEKKHFLGQAYAYRAMCYLDLARMYEPKENNYTDVSHVLGLTVPLITEYTTQEEAENNPRLPREAIYTFILADLEKAEAYLKDASNNFNSPNLAAVYGMYARAYIEMGYWKKGGDTDAFISAADYARKAITTSGKTPLTEDQWTDPVTGFNDGDSNNSWIWGLTVSKENLVNLVAYTAHISNDALWGYSPYTFVGINKALYDKMDDKDFRRKSFLSPDESTWQNGTYKYSNKGNNLLYFFQSIAKPYLAIKFRPAQGECIDYNIGNAADHPLMRMEEMLFLEMEAIANYNLAKAKELLNDFMSHRVLDGSYDCSRYAIDFDTFIDEMLVQKRAEFWGEGVLYFDYKRLDAGITRHYTGTNHPQLWQFNTEGRSPQWNFVINRAEFQANSGIDESTNNPDPSGLLIVPAN